MSWTPNKRLQQIAKLEKTDPEIRKLGQQIEIAIETGRGEDAANARFNRAVDRKLGIEEH